MPLFYKVGGILVHREIANAVYRIVKREARGEANAIAKRDLWEKVNAHLRGCSLTCTRRVLDAAVTLNRNQPDAPICTTGKGVFWATRRSEITKARHYVTSRFDDLRAAKTAYDSKLEAWDARHDPRLFKEPDHAPPRHSDPTVERPAEGDGPLRRPASIADRR